MLSLVRYSITSVTILWFYSFYLTHFQNVFQMLVVNVFAMMPEKHCYYWNVKRDDKLSLDFWKKYSLSLLVRIRIKTHLPVKSSLFYSGKITTFWGRNYWVMNNGKKRGIPKSLELEDKPSVKLLIYIKKNNSLRTN